MILRWLVACALTLTASEACRAGYLAYSDGYLSLPASLRTALLSASLLLSVSLACSFPLGWLFSGDRLGAFYRSFSRGVVGREGRGSLAAAVLLLCQLPAVGLALLFGRLAIEALSPPFAALATVLGAALLLACGLALAARLGPSVTNVVARVSEKTLALTLSGGVGCGLLSLLFWARATFSPNLWLPLALPIGLSGLCSYPPLARRLLRPRLAPTSASALAVLLGLSLTSLSAPDAEVRKQVATHAFFSSAALKLCATALDSDGDGHAPAPFGNDCNDAAPNINPDAIDKPDNDIDENCTGKDAATWQEKSATPPALIEAVQEKNPIVIILVEAVRPDHVGFAGYSRNTTPHLDKFRQSATFFENAFTLAPTTKFALGSILVGRDIRTVNPHKSKDQHHYYLKSKVVTLAERLRTQGYDAVGYTLRWVLTYMHGFNQGFRIFKTPHPNKQRPNRKKLPALTTDKAIAFLKSRKQDARPYLLYLHYGCPHAPYIKSPEFDFGKKDLDRYDAQIAHCDKEVARAIKAIEAQPDGPQTSIFVVSDHGESFGEHGIYHHGYALTESQIRILMLARIPGFDARQVRRAVSIADIGYTAAILGGRPLAAHSSVRSLLASDNDLKRKISLFTDLPLDYEYKKADGVLRYPWKFIRDRDSGLAELYNIHLDPQEKHNQFKRQAALGAELSQWVDSYTSYAQR